MRVLFYYEIEMVKKKRLNEKEKDETEQSKVVKINTKRGINKVAHIDARSFLAQSQSEPFSSSLKQNNVR